jgi:hypothetical protein
MIFSDFSAKRAAKQQSPIAVSSNAIPRLPVSLSLVLLVPRTNIRSPRLRSGKIAFSDPKRVLQHHLPGAELIRINFQLSVSGMLS